MPYYHDCDQCGLRFRLMGLNCDPRRFCSLQCLWINRKGKAGPKPVTAQVQTFCPTCGKNFTSMTFKRRTGEKRPSIYCSTKCKGIAIRGKPLSEETKSKLSVIFKKRGIPSWLHKRGKDHPCWKEGLDRTVRLRMQMSIDYQEWRKKVLKRDGYACQGCGAKNQGPLRPTLHVHHIKSFIQFPELRMDVNNGITLCKPCHTKTESWGRKPKKIGELQVV